MFVLPEPVSLTWVNPYKSDNRRAGNTASQLLFDPCSHLLPSLI